jgi:hypothetical protein
VPAVLSLEGRFGARGLRVVGVTKDGEDADEKKTVADTAREEKMTYPTFLDVDGRWSSQADVGLNPIFLLIGRDGKLAYRFGGKLLRDTDDYAALERAVEAALSRPPPS